MIQNKKQVKFLNSENGETAFVLNGATSPAFWNPNGNFMLTKDVEKGKIGLWKINP